MKPPQVARSAPQPAGTGHVRARVLASDVLDLLFREARSHNGWLQRPIDDAMLFELYNLLKMAPTSMNCCPARFVFVRTPENKERLRPALAPANVTKVMTAPVVVVIGYDLAFYDHLGRLFPHRPDLKQAFEHDATLSRDTAFRNGTLQGAYLMLAARSLGLDCGPLSGFDAGLVSRAFFAGTQISVNFLCCLGYGDPSLLFPRLPRFEFAEVCTLA